MDSLDTTIDTHRGIIYTESNFSPELQPPSAHLGALLAWDTTESKYIPASAIWADMPKDDGSVLPADSAYVIGVLVSGDDTSGTILSYGCIESPATIAAILNYSSPEDTTFYTGPYYLGESGKAIHVSKLNDSDRLPVYCFTYTSTSKLVFNPRVPERYGHNHGAYDLSDIFDGSVSSYTPPDGSALSAALALDHACHLFKNGVLLTSGEHYTIADGTLTLIEKPLVDDSVVLFTVTPAVGFEPLVHSISIADASNKILSATTQQGDVELTFKSTPTATEDISGVAVTEIGVDGVKTGPVVQRLLAGVGTDIKAATDASGAVIKGTYQVSANSGLYDYRDLQVCNLDGVLFGIDDTKVSYMFPAGTTSILHGTFRLPYFDEGSRFNAQLSLLIAGATTYPNLHISLTQINPGGYRVTSEFDASPDTGSAQTGYDYELLVDIGEVSQPNRLLLCSITCDNGSTNALTLLGAALSLKH